MTCANCPEAFAAWFLIFYVLWDRAPNPTDPVPTYNCLSGPKQEDPALVLPLGKPIPGRRWTGTAGGWGALLVHIGALFSGKGLEKLSGVWMSLCRGHWMLQKVCPRNPLCVTALQVALSSPGSLGQILPSGSGDRHIAGNARRTLPSPVTAALNEQKIFWCSLQEKGMIPNELGLTSAGRFEGTGLDCNSQTPARFPPCPFPVPSGGKK